MSEISFSRVFTHAVSLLPRLKNRNPSLIYTWVERFDVERDILPAITYCAKCNPEISTFSYFMPAIEQAHKQRIEGPKKRKEVEFKPSVAPTPNGRATTIRCKMKYSQWVSDNDLAWLAKYELEKEKALRYKEEGQSS